MTRESPDETRNETRHESRHETKTKMDTKREKLHANLQTRRGNTRDRTLDTSRIKYPNKDDAWKSLLVLNKHNNLFVALTIFTVFSCVTSLTHTKVPLVCKSIQASRIVMAHVDTTFVLVRKTASFHNQTPHFSL